ncbi:hypothetical protein MBOT_34140 [Mycobacterium botniense]|uniref:Uncharacterized protein n=1 Tax=Mycobacterium botniense TaxID=84962 RepID=A0A7I9Y1V3_9MYCO|nr:hypothetical protein MBOT_34140 [Mycobacterium botniense]
MDGLAPPVPVAPPVVPLQPSNVSVPVRESRTIREPVHEVVVAGAGPGQAGMAGSALVTAVSEGDSAAATATDDARPRDT